VIIFSSVRFLSKKVTKTGFKKNRNRIEPVQTDRFWFGLVILGKNQFKPVWLDFRFGSVFFPVFFGLGSVWFFRFQAYKTETEPNWSAFSKF
jgi:hypothetical protein